MTTPMAVVLPTAGRSRLGPLDSRAVRIEGGFWGKRLRMNRERSIPHGLQQLEASGAIGNFRNAARRGGRYVGGIDDAGLTFPFLDSDVYKWLEAVAWESGRQPDPLLSEGAGEVIDLVANAQREDGYLNTFVQLSGREPYTDLQWGHELYCIGHLTQAAVAWRRALGDDRLVRVATLAIEHVDANLGDGQTEGIDGHPELEMALVELYRATGDDRYLAMASLQVERRGRGLLGVGRMGSSYWQDHRPVREAPTMTGHAVRQLYLDCGVVDVATETGDTELLGAVVRRWEDMWATRTYITGALGSRHRDEAFGDAFELPPDRAYAETCAAIASVMLCWRLLLATGDARFADALERTLYNAVLPGLALEGADYFYSNPLQLRSDAATTGVAREARAPWYPCACCPPNLMRTLSSFEHLIATLDADGMQLQQYADATISASVGEGEARIRIRTDYPWDGRVEIEVESAPAAPWRLGLRVPAWVGAGTITVAGGDPTPLEAGDPPISIERPWTAGERVVLDLAMPPRLTEPDPRIDAVRGCLAIERGPLVYCLEGVDLPPGIALEDVELVRGEELAVVDGPAGIDGMRAIRAAARHRTASRSRSSWPYAPTVARDDGSSGSRLDLTAVPYLAWANREPGPMRVWVPRSLGSTERARADDHDARLASHDR